MKAITPVHPQDSSSSSSSSGSSQLSLHYLSKQSLNIARCRMEEEDLFCLQYDMNDCYSRLKRLVPTIPQDKKVSKVEILQHVIDYILDLQLALETHPSLQKQQPQRTCPPTASNPNRTPLTVLNIDHHQVSFIPCGCVCECVWGGPSMPNYRSPVSLRQSTSYPLCHCPFSSADKKKKKDGL